MTLSRPDLLWMGPTAALLLAVAVGLQWRRIRRLAAALGPAVLTRRVGRDLSRAPVGRVVCLVAGAIAIGVAAAAPTAEGSTEPEPPGRPLDVVVAVDVSLSMGAGDGAPTRLDAARDAVVALVGSLPDARVALIVFADWPFVLVPPTDDPALVEYFARSLATSIVLDRDQGTRLSATLAGARETLDTRPRAGADRAIVILSDGGGHEPSQDVLAAAASAAEGGVGIWTVGVGTEAGAPVLSSTGPVEDDSGTPVLAPLDDDLLREIARVGGGRYRRLGERGAIEGLAGELRGPGDGARPRRRGTDPGFWLILAALPLLLAEGAIDAGRLRRPTRTSASPTVAGR